MSTIKLYGNGTRRFKIYIDRQRAAKLQPPIVVEAIPASGRLPEKHFTSRVEGKTYTIEWSGNNTDKPAIWITELGDINLVVRGATRREIRNLLAMRGGHYYVTCRRFDYGIFWVVLEGSSDGTDTVVCNMPVSASMEEWLRRFPL